MRRPFRLLRVCHVGCPCGVRGESAAVVLSGRHAFGFLLGLPPDGPGWWFSCYPSIRTTAGCPSGQWEWTVNPSRELRRFESFTCHRVRERASDQRKRRSEALGTYTGGGS